ncbi:hypothetical protein ACJX0J_006466, partial [Zea mays]
PQNIVLPITLKCVSTIIELISMIMIIILYELYLRVLFYKDGVRDGVRDRFYIINLTLYRLHTLIVLAILLAARISNNYYWPSKIWMFIDFSRDDVHING